METKAQRFCKAKYFGDYCDGIRFTVLVAFFAEIQAFFFPQTHILGYI